MVHTDKNAIEKRLQKLVAAYKKQNIPASLKSIYSDIEGSGEGELLYRQLVVGDHVDIEIEYAPDGSIVAVYRIDKKGRRISMDYINEAKKEISPELIAKRFQDLSQSKTKAPRRRVVTRKKMELPSRLKKEMTEKQRD